MPTKSFELKLFHYNIAVSAALVHGTHMLTNDAVMNAEECGLIMMFEYLQYKLGWEGVLPRMVEILFDNKYSKFDVVASALAAGIDRVLIDRACAEY